MMSAPPPMASKVATPPHQSQVTSPTAAAAAFPDPFGLPANPSNNAFNAFPTSNDPFGTSRADDPFFSATASAGAGPKLDESDPFRAVDFDAAHELMKKSMANRSKTPGANMFGGSDFNPPAAPQVNRPQSAMPWEPTRPTPPQPGTQAFSDLFDVFG